MKEIQWGVFSKKQQERQREESEQRNEVFVEQQFKLPSGATYTKCKAMGDDDRA